MPNIEYVNGLEKAVKILESCIAEYRASMEDWNKCVEKLTGSPLFVKMIQNDYLHMFEKAYSHKESLEWAILKIQKEIEREMSVDADIEGEAV